MGHFYNVTKAGVIEPRHFQTIKSGDNKGKDRGTTLRDVKSAAKKGEAWFPSVTTVLNLLDKPGLKKWKDGKLLETAWDMSDHTYDGGLDAWMPAVIAETERKLDEAPKLGTDLHDVLEQFFKSGRLPSDPLHAKICGNVKNTLDQACGAKQEWEAEKYVANTTEGYAGCADLVSPQYVIDFKVKTDASKWAPGRMAWPEMVLQLAAYRDCDGIQATMAANLFINPVTGETDYHPYSYGELDLAIQKFKLICAFYRLDKFDVAEVYRSLAA